MEQQNVQNKSLTVKAGSTGRLAYERALARRSVRTVKKKRDTGTEIKNKPLLDTDSLPA